MEQKQGISQLELLCSEFELEEKNKEHKKELKRQKKKKSKQSKKNQDLALEFKVTQPVFECLSDTIHVIQMG